ncbi:MAG: pyruvate, water dikinase [Gammaproteobacteria bacterium]|nr:MAG: pyruvate, water dikinase [Gammaproteobacteria bacterium]
MKPYLIELKDISGHPVGGKASGLASLVQMGLAVPEAFVVVNAIPGVYPDDLEARYGAMGYGQVAVRSSAVGEDGVDASFAGQYETILNVEGFDALRVAIDQCVASLESHRASAYKAQQFGDVPVTMSVVIQRMIQPRAAGVLFSVDPVSARRDRLVIDAVTGLGEQLVSGEVTPDHYKVDLAGKVAQHDLAGDQAILSVTDIDALVAGARKAVRVSGHELDMEWAIDTHGQLHWLQARPITALPADLNEFDTPIDQPDDVWTRCNIGEMMPGAVAPLTLSVTGWGIEHGMQDMQVKYGVEPAIVHQRIHIKNAFGHFFINLSATAPAASRIIGVDLQQMARAICGRELPELKAPAKAPAWVRIRNFIRMVRYVLAIPKVIAAFEPKLNAFVIEPRDNSIGMLDEIDQKFDFYLEAYDVHMQSSAGSGFTEGILQRMISQSDVATAEEQAEAARLLQGAEGVESAILVKMLDESVDAIAKVPSAKERFWKAEPASAYAWLSSPEAGKAREVFEAFMARHGHRGYRELSMETPCWADDPLPLVQIMQASIAARFSTNVKAGAIQHAKVDMASLDAAVRWFLPKAHAAVRRREQTKSYLAKATNHFKRAYRRVGELLEQEGRLPDSGLVFFLTREELRDLAANADEVLVKQALLRREALPYQERLEFEDVVIGFPEPVVLSARGLGDDGVLVGRPVSRGVVEGFARVALTLEEAAGLQPGEILVAPITDVGWTPYFSLIAGLATDVGSAVSHGCVIAREYGLPAVVNLRSATRDFKTGDRVRLDGDHGTLTLLHREGDVA